MKRGGKFLASTTDAWRWRLAATEGKLEIRSTPTPLARGQAAPFRPHGRSEGPVRARQCRAGVGRLSQRCSRGSGEPRCAGGHGCLLRPDGPLRLVAALLRERARAGPSRHAVADRLRCIAPASGQVGRGAQRARGDLAFAWRLQAALRKRASMARKSKAVRRGLQVAAAEAKPAAPVKASPPPQEPVAVPRSQRRSLLRTPKSETAPEAAAQVRGSCRGCPAAGCARATRSVGDDQASACAACAAGSGAGRSGSHARADVMGGS